MDDHALWEAFSASSLPEKEWTHQAHLRVAWLFLKRHPLDEAHILMRVGIIRLNAFHGLVETPARGYHETLTRVWLLLVASLMKTTDAPSSDAFVTACGDALGRGAVLQHYSRDRVVSVSARAAFVEPDLLDLPAT
jgi:hypothetical protein